MATRNAPEHDIDRLIAGNAAFRVGSRVQVKECCEDYYCFDGTDTGVVIDNDGKYLGIIVKFDKPRWIQGHWGEPWEMEKFNFNGRNLTMLKPTEPAGYVPGLTEVWDV